MSNYHLNLAEKTSMDDTEWITMNGSLTKPRLAFFRTTEPDPPSFIRRHLEEHVRCLSLFFDVRLISGECDYDRVCDVHQPDLSLFESGVYRQRHEIQNADTHPYVPKLGFLHADAFCESRTVFLADMARWGVETFFTLSVAMAEYIPEIADRLFVWPNFVDDLVFRDYGQLKVIPVLLTGSQAMHYPWRNRISRVVSAAYPTMICPHPGWSGRIVSSRMMEGEIYAKLLNSAHVAPACGGVTHEVVRKHFEIPAARSCLMSERAESLLAAGFIDMENCVFTDENDVLDKLDYLFSKPEELARIIDAGHELVHARHTARQRDELLQWLNLHKGLAAHEKIVQRGPFTRLEVVTSQRDAVNAHVISGGVDRELLRRGAVEQQAGNYEVAQQLYRRCLNYRFTMPEPLLKLVECALATGRPADALHWVTISITESVEVRRSFEPDPVEWAYYIRTLMCQGKVGEATRRASQFPALNHEELNRIRSALGQICADGLHDLSVSSGPLRSSLHVRAQQSSQKWLAELCKMLDACAQYRLSELLRAREPQFQSTLSKLSQVSPATLSGDVDEQGGPEAVLMAQARWSDWIRSRLRLWRDRFFGPDDFGRMAQQLAQREPVKRAYIIGSSARRGCHRAIMKGFMANPSGPTVHRLSASQPGSWPHAAHSLLSKLTWRSGEVLTSRTELDETDCDLVFILGEAAVSTVDIDRLSGARAIVLDGISGQSGQKAYQRMSELDDLTLVACDPSDGDGYAVYQRLAWGFHRTVG